VFSFADVTGHKLAQDHLQEEQEALARKVDAQEAEMKELREAAAERDREGSGVGH
jgi:hypothetical protein